MVRSVPYQFNADVSSICAGAAMNVRGAMQTLRAPVWIPYATGVMSSMWCDQAGHAQTPTVIVESGSSDAQPAAQLLFWTGVRSAGLKRVTTIQEVRSVKLFYELFVVYLILNQHGLDNFDVRKKLAVGGFWAPKIRPSPPPWGSFLGKCFRFWGPLLMRNHLVFPQSKINILSIRYMIEYT